MSDKRTFPFGTTVSERIFKLSNHSNSIFASNPDVQTIGQDHDNTLTKTKESPHPVSKSSSQTCEVNPSYQVHKEIRTVTFGSETDEEKLRKKREEFFKEMEIKKWQEQEEDRWKELERRQVGEEEWIRREEEREIERLRLEEEEEKRLMNETETNAETPRGKRLRSKEERRGFDEDGQPEKKRKIEGVVRKDCHVAEGRRASDPETRHRQLMTQLEDKIRIFREKELKIIGGDLGETSGSQISQELINNWRNDSNPYSNDVFLSRETFTEESKEFEERAKRLDTSGSKILKLNFADDDHDELWARRRQRDQEIQERLAKIKENMAREQEDKKKAEMYRGEMEMTRLRVERAEELCRQMELQMNQQEKLKRQEILGVETKEEILRRTAMEILEKKSKFAEESQKEMEKEQKKIRRRQEIERNTKEELLRRTALEILEQKSELAEECQKEMEKGKKEVKEKLHRVVKEDQFEKIWNKQLRLSDNFTTEGNTIMGKVGKDEEAGRHNEKPDKPREKNELQKKTDLKHFMEDYFIERRKKLEKSNKDHEKLLKYDRYYSQEKYFEEGERKKNEKFCGQDEKTFCEKEKTRGKEYTPDLQISKIKLEKCYERYEPEVKNCNNYLQDKVNEKQKESFKKDPCERKNNYHQSGNANLKKEIQTQVRNQEVELKNLIKDYLREREKKKERNSEDEKQGHGYPRKKLRKAENEEMRKLLPEHYSDDEQWNIREENGNKNRLTAVDGKDLSVKEEKEMSEKELIDSPKRRKDDSQNSEIQNLIHDYLHEKGKIENIKEKFKRLFENEKPVTEKRLDEKEKLILKRGEKIEKKVDKVNLEKRQEKNEEGFIKNDKLKSNDEDYINLERQRKKNKEERDKHEKPSHGYEEKWRQKIKGEIFDKNRKRFFEDQQRIGSSRSASAEKERRQRESKVYHSGDKRTMREESNTKDRKLSLDKGENLKKRGKNTEEKRSKDFWKPMDEKQLEDKKTHKLHNEEEKKEEEEEESIPLDVLEYMRTISGEDEDIVRRIEKLTNKVPKVHDNDCSVLTCIKPISFSIASKPKKNLSIENEHFKEEEIKPKLKKKT